MRKIEPVFPMLHEAITLGLILCLEDHNDLLIARRSSIAYCPQWAVILAPHPDPDEDHELFEDGIQSDVRFFILRANIVPVTQI